MDEGIDKGLIKEIALLKERLARKDREIEEIKMGGVFLETLFDGIHEQIMVIDEDFRIQDVNQVFLRHCGLKKEEVLGRRCYQVLYRSHQPCVFDRQPCPLEKARETGRRIEVTHYHRLEGGDLKELVRIMYPVSVEGKRPKYFVEISRDVTEYRRLIKRLQASEKRIRNILDTATDGILSVDQEQRIVLFNDAAEKIFGYSRKEVMGKNLNILIPRQYGDHHRYIRRFLATRTPKVLGETLSLTALRKGGEEFPIELSLSYHEMEGEVTFTAIIRDVSRQKQLEKKLLQSERLAAVGKTVAHVAHEIKNPLMIIGGFSQQIKQTLTDEKALQKLDMILDEVSRLERLVQNLGDFTREYRLMKRPADINSVLRDVLSLMSETSDPDKYEFEASLRADLREITCDPDKLKQVFINIITNGLEAMEQGGRIRVSTAECAKGIEIRISDEGVGIEEEALDHIFEPFFTTREGGSGLGLSISYKIVQAHKGDIWAESRPGKGTTFTIQLPC